MLFHLGKEHARLGQHSAALIYLLKSLQAVTVRGTWVARLYGDIIATLILLGRASEALAMTREALVHFPTSHELLFRQAELLEIQGNRACRREFSAQPAAGAQQNRFGDTLSSRELRRQAYRSVGSACLGRQEYEPAEHLFQQWIAEAPGDIEAWCMLGYCYVRGATRRRPSLSFGNCESCPVAKHRPAASNRKYANLKAIGTRPASNSHAPSKFPRIC